jgi:hypothetical protein
VNSSKHQEEIPTLYTLPENSKRGNTSHFIRIVNNYNTKILTKKLQEKKIQTFIPHGQGYDVKILDKLEKSNPTMD